MDAELVTDGVSQDEYFGFDNGAEVHDTVGSTQTDDETDQSIRNRRRNVVKAWISRCYPVLPLLRQIKKHYQNIGTLLTHVNKKYKFFYLLLRRRYAVDAVERATAHLNDKTESGLGLDLDSKTNDLSEDQVLGSLDTNNWSEDLLPL